MAISFVGTANGTTSATLPAHQAGDLIVIFAVRDGSSTPPTVPAGYTQITTRATNTIGGVSGYKIAASSSETSGTWTNATGIIVGVYRGSAGTMTVGGSVTAGGASTTVSYAAVTSVNTNYNSWWIGVSGHRSVDTNLQNPPTNMTNRGNRVDATDELALHDTNGTALTAWTARTVSVSGTSSGWSAAVIEIYETIADGTSPISLLGVAAKVTSTTSTITPDRTTGSLSGVSYQAGDVFVLSIASWTSGSGTTSMSADWTREANISTTNGPTMAVWWHRYDGVTMPSFTATYSASDTAMVAGLAAFRGVKASGSPWNVTRGSFSNSYPMALTPLTTTVDGCRILAISGEDGIEDYPEPTGPWSSSIWTDGGGVGNFQHDNAGNGAAIAAWHYAQTTAGSTLGLALILNGTGFGVRHWMGALEPASGGADQNVTAPSYSDADSFGSHTVTTSNSVSATKLTNTQSFGSPVVTTTAAVSATTFTNVSTFGAGSVSLEGATQNVSGPAFSNASSFGSAVVTTSNAVSATKLTNTSSFGSGSVSTTNAVSATLFVNANTFGTYTVTIESSPQPSSVVIDADYVAPRAKFWSQKQSQWLEDRLEQIRQAAPKPRKARKRIAREILTELPQVAESAPQILKIDVVRSLLERIAAPSPDYTAIAAVVAAQMQQIEAERTARRRKRDMEAVLILAA